MLERARADRWNSNVWRQVILPSLVLLLIMLGCSSSNDGELQVMSEVPERIGYDKETGLTVQAATFTNLYTASATQLAQKILGVGITIESATFTGHPQAAGIFSFSDEDDVIGFNEGIVLSSGRITDLIGPNVSSSATFDFLRPGDPDLNALVGTTTYDAAVLTIAFTPNADTVFLSYVFGSEEYNEYVNSRFNDVFAFLVNGVNYALINDKLVAVNTVNCGNTSPAAPGYPNIAQSTEFYRNNRSGAQAHCPSLNLHTELDGLTVVLTLEAPVRHNEINTIKLAIADTADHILDAAVFIKAGSFSTTPPTSQPPVADAGGPYAGFEGFSVSFDGTASSGNNEDTLTFAWDFGDSYTGSGATPRHTYLDNGVYPVTLIVNSATMASDSTTTTATIANVAPSVEIVIAPMEPVPVNTSVTVTGSFTDPGVLDTHAAVWDWGDGVTSAGVVTQGAGYGSVTGNHSYTTPGVYTLTLTVTDKDGDAGSATHQFIVVYDPNGGFVTGGGWFESPAGAYTAEPMLTGKASFGFVSKYLLGAKTPVGQTEFQFRAASLNFHSSAYEWLVISGSRAQYKGTGTINGAPGYGFLLTAIDGQVSGGGGTDRFRIKIWDASGVVYDNQIEAVDDAALTTVLGGGSIVIHNVKK